MSRIAFAPPPSPRLSNGGRRVYRRRRPLIGLTPLIDVVFILLVFFMLASSFLDWRSIDLDAPGRAGAAASLSGAMLVEVRPDGLRLSGRPVALDALTARVDGLLDRQPERRVLVRPTAGVSLQEVVAVLDRLSAAGVDDLSLLRDPNR